MATDTETAGPMMIKMPPLLISLCFSMGFAVLFEPLRLGLLHEFPHELGGVGGVGGLANLGGPDHTKDDEAYSCSQHFHGNYCYKKGINGSPFTVLILVTILGWVGPWILGSMAHVVKGNSTRASANNDTATMNWIPIFQAFWIGINALWFLVPLGPFWFSLAKQTPNPDDHDASKDHDHVGGSILAKHILAISLSASYPLSWNLMYVAMPVTGILNRLLRTTRKNLFACHRVLAYTTAFWAILHGGGELLYLLMAKTQDGQSRFARDFDIWNGNGENLIYVLGLVCFVLMTAHVGASYCRKQIGEDTFRPWHRRLAFTLILVAAGHWWPLALFLLPALALHGCSGAIGLYFRRHPHQAPSTSTTSTTAATTTVQVSHCIIPDETILSDSFLALLLLVALLAALASYMAVWSCRHAYMLSDSANLYWPFIFPVMGVLLSFLAAFGAVWSSLINKDLCCYDSVTMTTTRVVPVPRGDEYTPLLNERQNDDEDQSGDVEVLAQSVQVVESHMTDDGNVTPNV